MGARKERIRMLGRAILSLMKPFEEIAQGGLDGGFEVKVRKVEVRNGLQ